MNKLKRFIAFCAICLLFTSSVGFAVVSDELKIEGTAEATPPRSVYIVNALQSGAETDCSVQIKGYSGTVLSSKVTLSTSATASVKISVEVFNNTAYGYVFNGIKYESGADTYDNADITVSVTDLKVGDALAVGAGLTFIAEFSYVATASAQNTVLNSAINFSFIPASEYVPDIAVDNALERFENILNDETENEEGKTLFEQLNDAFENTTGSRPNNDNGKSYIGNVVGSSGVDSEAIEKLFTVDGENKLVLDINGEKTNVTVLIKREDIDGDSSNGKEITLYLTPEEITGEWDRMTWSHPYHSPIYAVVYRCEKDEDGNEKWSRIGETYEGKATKTHYDYTEDDWTKYDSFDTGAWITTQSYYGLSAGVKIETLMAYVD